jgi:hypothetical protein
MGTLALATHPAPWGRQAWRLLKRCTLVSEDAHGYRFEVPVTWVRVAPPPRRTLTEEQRRAIQVRLAASKARTPRGN